jgi:hypothetical protein
MTASAQSINMEQIERDIATQKQMMDDLYTQFEMLRTQKGQTSESEKGAALSTGVKQPKKDSSARDVDLEEDKKGRRPRPLTLENRIHLFQNQPSTLRGTAFESIFSLYRLGVLERFCLQEMALQHWLKKRPILVGDFQTIERALSRYFA